MAESLCRSLPEQLGLLFVARPEHVHALVGLGNGHDGLAGGGQRLLVVRVELEDEHGNGVALVLHGLGLVLDGLDVLGAELLQGGNLDQVAVLANLVAQADHVPDDQHGVVHGPAVELQAEHAGVGQGRVAGEGGLGDDAVHAFLLHAGQPAQVLVGHVLAQALAANLAAGQGHGVDALAGLVENLEHGHVRGVDLVARVVLAPDFDERAVGPDHAVAQDVVDGGAVLEGERPARVFRDVAAQGGPRLGGRGPRSGAVPFSRPP